MQFNIIDELVLEVSAANTNAQLSDAMTRVKRRLDFDHFALAYEHRTLSASRTSILLHDYPDAWAKTYIEFELAGDDPVRRACERTMTGFAWRDISRLVPLTRGDLQMLSIGAANGIGDGYTVPRHLPGYASGSCTFAIAPDKEMPMHMLPVAEIVGAFALTSARRIAGELPVDPRPVLSQRQRECVLWSARGKTRCRNRCDPGYRRGYGGPASPDRARAIRRPFPSRAHSLLTLRRVDQLRRHSALVVFPLIPARGMAQPSPLFGIQASPLK